MQTGSDVGLLKLVAVRFQGGHVYKKKFKSSNHCPYLRTHQGQWSQEVRTTKETMAKARKTRKRDKRERKK